MRTDYICDDLCWVLSAVLVVSTFPISIPLCIVADRRTKEPMPFYIPSWKKRKIAELFEDTQRRLEEEAQSKTYEYLTSTSPYSMTV